MVDKNPTFNLRIPFKVACVCLLTKLRKKPVIASGFGSYENFKRYKIFENGEIKCPKVGETKVP